MLCFHNFISFSFAPALLFPTFNIKSFNDSSQYKVSKVETLFPNMNIKVRSFFHTTNFGVLSFHLGSTPKKFLHENQNQNPKIIEPSKPINTINHNRYPIATKTKPKKTLPKHYYMAFVINNKPSTNNQTFKVAQKFKYARHLGD